MNKAPLIVDLDGTLVRTGMLRDATPRSAGDGGFDASQLPYDEALLAWLQEERAAGRRIVLRTAFGRAIADAVAAHLGVFDGVLAGDGADAAGTLAGRLGHDHFDYVGNGGADATGPRDVAHALPQPQPQPQPPRRVTLWRKALRVHQWMKNLLLFVPMLAAHRVADVDGWLTVALAFVSFSLCASTVYIGNDLLDLESDRAHPRKRLRPFASGALPGWQGIALAPVLLGASVALATFVGGTFLPWLMFYFGLTCAYSWGLKRVVLLDCITLAMLYTLRITAGAAALSIAPSFWLLACSVFLFLSLAFVKRYAELQALPGGHTVHGRGYRANDAPLVLNLGVTAGYASAVVLALYLNSEAVLTMYRRPEAVWGAVPVLVFWISWIWMQAHRGRMHDDPVVFAVKDRASWLAGFAFGAALVAGARGWP